MSFDEKKKRKVTFSSNADADAQKKQKTTTTTTDQGDQTRLHSAKYTLDSDEEDEEERQDRQQMNPDELEGSSLTLSSSHLTSFLRSEIGQERATIGFDEDVKITPFNIDDELEDGHYDETGCFQWKKKEVCLSLPSLLSHLSLSLVLLEGTGSRCLAR